MITTSPPESVHAVGLALRRRGVPWVADVRDAWTFESLRPALPDRGPAPARRAARAPLARRAPTRSSASPSRPPTTSRRRGIATPLLVPNGWDPEPAPAPAEPTGLLDPDRRLARLHRPLRQLRPRPAARWSRRWPSSRAPTADAAARLELVVAGPLTDDEAALFATDVSPARIVVAGSLDARARPRAAARGRRAAAGRPADPLPAAQHQAVRVPGERSADPRAGRGNRGGAGRRARSAPRWSPPTTPAAIAAALAAGRGRRARGPGARRRRRLHLPGAGRGHGRGGRGRDQPGAIASPSMQPREVVESFWEAMRANDWDAAAAPLRAPTR